MKSILILFSLTLLLFSSCKKEEPPLSIICETIECFPAIVGVNGNEYPFEYSSIFGYQDSTINMSITNQFILAQEEMYESFRLIGVPFKEGKFNLGNSIPNAGYGSYSLGNIPNGNIEEAYLIEDYDNWIEITEICDSALKGTAHFQLLEAGGNHSILYDGADTLTVHFNFSVCP